MKNLSEWWISDRDSSQSEKLLNQLTYSVDPTLRKIPCHHRLNCLGIESREVNVCTSTWWFTAWCHKNNEFRPHLSFQNSTTCGAQMRVFWVVTPYMITRLFWFYLVHICAHIIDKVVLIISLCSSRFFCVKNPVLTLMLQHPPETYSVALKRQAALFSETLLSIYMNRYIRC